jgi:hypothetical protein
VIASPETTQEAKAIAGELRIATESTRPWTASALATDDDSPAFLATVSDQLNVPDACAHGERV